MRLTSFARVLLALGLGGLGLLSLRYRDFALVWQPVPAGLPLRSYLAGASGALLLAGGIALLVKRFARPAATVLTLFVFLWLVLLQVPRVAGHPRDAGIWLGFGENLLLVTGAWVLCLLLRAENRTAKSPGRRSDGALRTARLLFGIALPLIGLAHFVYAEATAGMVPAWLPARKAFAYLTGAGHIAAGVAIVFRLWPRLAATLEAAMIAGFVVLLHAPGVMKAPGDRLQWTMLCIAMAYDGAAWAVAASYGRKETV